MSSETTQEAIDKLAALTDIAGWLEREGYSGVPFVADLCVLAQYLGDKTGHRHSVCGEFALDYETGQSVELPDHVYSFVKAFDRGDFESLVS